MNMGEINMHRLSSNGKKIELWSIVWEGNHYYTVSGQQDGKMKQTVPTYCIGKNEGRSNETTPEVQCEMEARSKVEKQFKKGYTLIGDSLGKKMSMMLAKKWQDYKDDVMYPAYVQPKLDGVRCWAKKDGFFSRDMNKFTSAPHIEESLKPFFDKYPDAILDGELFSEGLDFNGIVGLVKSEILTDDVLARSEKHIRFHMFDIVDDSKSFELRFLSNPLVQELEQISKYVHAVSTKIVYNEQDVEGHHKFFVQCKYEGTMIRWGLENYEFKKTKNLLKFKDFVDAEFEVVDILEGRGKFAGTVGKWELKTTDGRTFKAGPTGTNEYNLDIWNNKEKYIGKMATIAYQELTPEGVPRFGKCKGIRELP